MKTAKVLVTVAIGSLSWIKVGGEGREPASYVGVPAGARGGTHRFHAETPQRAAALGLDRRN